MPIDLDEYRDRSRESWGRMASGWERRREWVMEQTGSVSDWLLEKLDPQAGQTVLELAAGTGDLGFRVAERVGDDGKVISTDFSPEMVDVAKRVGKGRGVTGVEHRVLDAERMDLDDDSVDAVVCRFGYMLMADPEAALNETRRVLRDGGPLALAVWMAAERNPWAAIPGMTLVQRGHMPPPEPDAPGIFALWDADRVGRLVKAAGFAEPELEEIQFEFHYSDADDAWDALVSLAGPFAEAVRALPEEERQASRQAILENMEQFVGEDGSYTAPAAAWGVLVRR
jgi:SAM-dependent methyltransferase